MNKLLFFLCFYLFLNQTVLSQGKTIALADYLPETNLGHIRIKNLNDIRTLVERYPEKKILYNDINFKLLKKLMGFGDDHKSSGAVESEEIKKLSKENDELLFSSIIGEVLLGIDFDLSGESNTSLFEMMRLKGLAIIDPVLYKNAYEKNLIFNEKKANKSIIQKFQILGIDCFSETNSIKNTTHFYGAVGDILVMSFNEREFKVTIEGIKNKKPLDKSLANNSKSKVVLT